MVMLINEKNIYGQIISIKYFFLLTFFRLSLYHIYDSEEQAFHKSQCQHYKVKRQGTKYVCFLKILQKQVCLLSENITKTKTKQKQIMYQSIMKIRNFIHTHTSTSFTLQVNESIYSKLTGKLHIIVRKTKIQPSKRLVSY